MLPESVTICTLWKYARRPKFVPSVQGHIPPFLQLGRSVRAYVCGHATIWLEHQTKMEYRSIYGWRAGQRWSCSSRRATAAAGEELACLHAYALREEDDESHGFEPVCTTCLC